MSVEVRTRIKDLRMESGISQRELAMKVGVSYASLQRYEYGTRDIPGDVLVRLAEFFGVTVDYLLYLTDGPNETVQVKRSCGFATVPLLGRIAAGEPLEMEEFDDYREAPAKFRDDDPNVFMLRVEGDSVNRIIPNGNFALISPKYREPNEHDLYAVCVNGYDATIKHVKKLANGFMLIPDSYDPTYRAQVFDYNDEATDEITIIGKVVWACMAY